MFGLPLHPLMVHFPVVLATFLPLLAIWVYWRSRTRPESRRRLWGVLVGFQGLIALTAFLAAQSGENDEEAIEEQVSEASLETHEEQGKRFALATVGATVVGLGGFVPGPVGMVAQVVTLAASVGQLGMIIPLGHSGATLVYAQGANTALAAAGGEGKGRRGEKEEEEEEEEGRRRVRTPGNTAQSVMPNGMANGEANTQVNAQTSSQISGQANAAANAPASVKGETESAAEERAEKAGTTGNGALVNRTSRESQERQAGKKRDNDDDDD